MDIKKLDKRSVDIGWQVGIMDIAGTITITKQKGRRSPWYRAYVCVVNLDKDILYPFRDMWGGKIYRDKEQKKGIWKPTYRWVCPTAKMTDFLELVGQYIRTKKELIMLVNNLLEHKAQTKHNILSEEDLKYREALYLRSLELNKKGIN